jgi:16S rRNA U1498 N3-methylase RsmE
MNGFFLSSVVQVRGFSKGVRVVLPEQILQEQGAYTLSAEDTKHLTKVLRCQTGDAFEIVTGSGQLQAVQLAAVHSSTKRQAACASVRTLFSSLLTQTVPISLSALYR